MANKTANLYARIEPDVKEHAKIMAYDKLRSDNNRTG